ncbi:coniferyl aldehyde dehydrogenase [Nocardia sp. NPDC058379]|uniref:coniferyl aldehyde dehydrogenase n=1 Tax=unclassified Nocardia TaxID=2637762 RepID=UPI003665BB1B
MDTTTTSTAGAGVHSDPAATDPAELPAMLARQRTAFLREGQPSAAVRRDRIDRLLAMVLDHIDDYAEAMSQDFGTRSRTGTLFAEILGMLAAFEHTRSHVARWMRPEKPNPFSRGFGIRTEIHPSPLGVVGIVGPWNFPLQLVVVPAASAFAGGNRVMIKMSEITSRTAELTRVLTARYFDPDELSIVVGGPEVGAAFTALPFDHLFFTGSTGVGRKVMRAAAENLVPVTLELGGKNPVVVGPGADLRRAANRIARARMVNGGQVCVCPDYVFVPEDGMARFTEALRSELRGMFPTIGDNDDYTSSVDDANYTRIVELIEDARARGARVESVAPEGESLPDPHRRKIAPTLIHDVTDDMRIATEEVFGPVLLLRPYTTLGEVSDHINAHPSPLVAYWYGPDRADFRAFVARTRSGGVARNEFAIHMFSENAPFGGVGHSGMGAYHGKTGFDTFSHRRTVAGTDLPFPITGIAAPPFGQWTVRIVDLALRAARWRTARRVAGRLPVQTRTADA